MNKVKDTEHEEIKRLLMSLLITQGISSVTLAKIVKTTQGNVSKMIPISKIQRDIKKYEKDIQRKTPSKSGE
ncbi:MAG: hypothetical protein ABIG99_01215 [Patescibacteria group bacterium]